MAMARVGVIGLGKMGKPVARRLIAAGFRVPVYNRSRAAIDELAREGAEPQPSARAVAANADAAITLLPGGPEVAEVLRGADGVFAGARPGFLAIDASTIAPSLAKELAAEAQARGIGFLDAPVSGGTEGAAAGALSIMAAGERSDFERAAPIFEAIGKTVTFCGAAGAGQVVKLCNQFVVALHLQAAAEALLLAERCGVESSALLSVLNNGLGASRVLEQRGAAMAARDFTARTGRPASQKKSLTLVLELAAQYGVVLPATAIVDQIFTAAIARGDADADHVALIGVLDALAPSGR